MFVDILWQDLKIAIRQIARNRGFTAMIVLTLAIGIGGMTAIFSVVRGVLLRPLPFESPDRIVTTTGAYRPVRGNAPTVLPPDRDWPSHNDIFEDVTLESIASMTMLDAGDPIYVKAERVTPNYLNVLRMKPFLGRTFDSSDAVSEPPAVALISYPFWQEHFAGSRDVVGRKIECLEGNLTIIGIMPRTFESPFAGGQPTDIWVPTQNPAPGPILMSTARLRPGISPAQAEKRLNAIMRQIENDNPGSYHRLPQVHGLPGAGEENSRLLLLLFAAVGFILFIAIINIANLMLSRALSREREVAIRSALGAGRVRLIRQLLTESLLLAFAGGFVGILFAYELLDLVLSQLPQSFPRIASIYIDKPVLGFAAAATVLSSVLFGILPAITTSKPDLLTALKEGTRQSSESRASRRIRSVLLTGEMALACTLLSAAAIVGMNFWNAINVPLGLDPQNVVIATLRLPAGRYQNVAARTTLRNQMLERLQGRAGIDSVAMADLMPLTAGSYAFFVRDPNGKVPLPDSMPAGPPPISSGVTSGYFQTLKIPFIAGRVFHEREAEIVVNESFAKLYWPDTSPIGKQADLMLGLTSQIFTIVGIVQDQNNAFFAGLDSRRYPQLFYPCDSCNILLLKTGRHAGNVGAAIRAEVTGIDRTIPITQLNSMDDLLMHSPRWANPRFRSTLFTAFSGAALLLALAGAYGVTSYSATQRIREIGIRGALGAGRRDLIFTMLAHSMIPVSIGVAAGLLGAWGLSRFAAAVVFESTVVHPALFVVVGVVLMAAVLCATIAPIWKAATTDPLLSLRSE